MDPIHCPTDQELSAYCLGDLPEDSLQSLADHLESCRSCQEKVRQWDAASDPVLEAIRRPAPATGPTGPASYAWGEGRETPSRLGDYRIVREVGRGGMGVVYEAIQESLGRRVALKTLTARPVLDAHLQKRFEREARAAAGLHHSNIVPVFGVGHEGGVRYYAMQFIEGEGLDRILRQMRAHRRAGAGVPGPFAQDGGAVPEAELAWELWSGHLPAGSGSGRIESAPGPVPDRPAGLPKAHPPRGNRPYYAAVARLGRQAAEALAYAHAQGILHRDVKPSNLLLDRQGTVWVTDFGLAKAVGEQEDLTQSGDLVGTLRYLAPERLSGRCDVRSDVYSLGLTLYELVTLRPAFEATDRNKLVQDVLHGAILRPRRLAPDLPRDLETILLKATAREPAQRYARAGALADDLRCFLEQRPIRARRIGVVGRTLRWARRHPLVALLLVSLILTLSAGFAGVTWNYRKAEAARAEESRQRTAADAARDQAEWSLYNSRIAQAQLHWQANDSAGAEKLLEACVPDSASGTDRRGWEWHYLDRLFHADRLPGMGHSARVWGVAFSPDGRQFASAGGGNPYFDSPGQHVVPGEVIVWDACDGHKRNTLTGHTHLVTAVAFIPDGTHLASVASTEVILWDARSGKVLWTYNKDRDASWHAPRCVAFAPDGGGVLVGCWRGDVRLLRLNDGTPWGRFSTGNAVVHTLAFSPNGKTVATASGTSEDSGEVRLWDWSARSEGRHPGEGTVPEMADRRLAAPGGLSRVGFSPDGRHLAAGGPRGVWVYQVPSGRLVQTLLVPGGGVTALAFGPDGRYLATGGKDRAVRVWDVLAGREEFVLRGHRGLVAGVHFSPDGMGLVSGSWDGTVRLWDATRSPEVSVLLEAPGSGGHALAWLQDGQNLDLVANLWSERLRIDARTGVIQGRQAVDLVPRWASLGSLAALDPQGQRVATVSALDPSVVTLTDRITGRELGRLRGHRLPLRHLAFSADGRLLASGGRDVAPGQVRSEVKVWGVTPEGALPAVPLFEREWKDLVLMAVAISSDGRRLAIGGYRSRPGDDPESPRSVVQVVDLPGGEEGIAVEIAGDRVSAVRFSPDGKRLAAVGFDSGTLLLGDLESGREIRVQTELPTAGDLAFTPDGSRLAVASRRMVKVLDARTAEELLALPSPITIGDPGSCPKVCFSPDGERLAALAAEDDVFLWDARAVDAGTEAERTFAWHLRQALKQEGFGRAFHLRFLAEREPPSLALRLAFAHACADLGDWDRAEANLDVVVDREPGVARHWLERGAVAARRGQWGPAAANFSRALDLEPASLAAWRLTAAALLLAGDTEGHRRLVARMRERFEGSEEKEISIVRARIEDLVPGNRPPRPLSENESRGLDPITRGCALLRAGQAGQACRVVEAEMKGDGTRKGNVLGLPLLALCHAGPGQTAEARQWLRQAEAVTTWPPEISLENWLEFLVLLREARSLLGTGR